MIAENIARLLVIGEYATGKTTFGGQLYERLKARQGILRLHSAPLDISPFADALKRLSQGVSPVHTPISAYNEIILPITTSNGRFAELIWPDYGGEQITDIIKTRKVNNTWVKRLLESNGWMLFIRLNSLTGYDSFLTRQVNVNVMREETIDIQQEEQTLSSTAAIIELLQMFLYVKRIGITQNPITLPSLLVLLSCWDEIDEDDQAKLPATLLQHRLPLVYEFIETLWKREHFSIWGLSSTGDRLDSEQSNEAYMDFGPRNFGYVIEPNGTRKDDLTLPLTRFME